MSNQSAEQEAPCNCVPIDGYRIRRQGGCPVHGPLLPRTVPETPPVELTEEQADLACAWADYRKDYGVGYPNIPVAHAAFKAGWKAAREGDQSGVLR